VEGKRYRCKACGNLTRFDVVRTRTTREYHHFSISGDLSVEDCQVVEEKVSAVMCRWCGNGKAVEIVPAPAVGLGRDLGLLDRPGLGDSRAISQEI